jgi:hypothetical protein
MNKLTPILIVLIAACGTKTEEKPAAAVDNSTYTKTMEYAVDLSSVFHQDLNDEDFSDVSPIAQNLIQDVLDGKLQAYDNFSDDPLTSEQVKAMLVRTDTIWYEEPETGDRSIEIVQRDYTTEFYGFTFREQWTYNQADAIIDRKVLGIAPRIPVFSSQGGTLRGFTSAFWVKYD